MLRPDFAEASTGRRAFTPELAEGQDERDWKHQDKRDGNSFLRSW